VFTGVHLCLISLSALVPLWQKLNQSKMTNYAKQSQFPGCQNERNLNPNNQLPFTIYQLPICKTNPIKPNAETVLSIKGGARTQMSSRIIYDFVRAPKSGGFLLICR
jgi:hypothetical protein